MAKFWRTVGIVAAFLLFVAVMPTAVMIAHTASTVMAELGELTYARAVMTKNFSLCEKIGDLTIKDECYETVAKEIEGGSLSDYESCDPIKNVRGKDICYRAFAWMEKFSSLSHALCDRISDNCYDDETYVVYDDGCIKLNCHDALYLDEARKIKDASICKKINYKGIRGTCYHDVAVSTNEAALCDFAESVKESCIFNVAVSKADLTLCGKLDPASKIHCNAVITGDVTLCNDVKVIKSGLRDSCLQVACAARPENRNTPACIAAQREWD